MTEYVVMPKKDYEAACNIIRQREDSDDLIKSGDLANKIGGLGGGEVIKSMCETSEVDLTGNNVEFVRASVFSNNSSLRSVSLKNAEKVEMRAFYACSNLETVSLPAVKTIAANAFYNNTKLKVLEIPNVENIGDFAFQYAGQQVGSSLENPINLELPNLEWIGTGAFNGCLILKTATLTKAREISERSFSGSSLVTFSAPLATVISKEAFSQCSELEGVSARNVSEIGESAFLNCTSFKGFIRGEDLTPTIISIGKKAFFNCEALTTEEAKLLTRNISTVPEDAFYKCSGITKVDLPVATEIGATAFSGCTNLTAVILRTTETVCIIDFSAFGETPLLTLQGFAYVPTSMYEYYRAGYSDALDEAMGFPGIFEMLFRKIEDYPEICG